jgi:hypothetical protein
MQARHHLFLSICLPVELSPSKLLLFMVDISAWSGYLLNFEIATSMLEGCIEVGMHVLISQLCICHLAEASPQSRHH